MNRYSLMFDPFPYQPRATIAGCAGTQSDDGEEESPAITRREVAGFLSLAHILFLCFNSWACNFIMKNLKTQRECLFPAKYQQSKLEKEEMENYYGWE